MSLKTRIETDMKTAMRAKDQVALRTLRSIKSMITLEETREGSSGTLTAEEELRVLTRSVKQRRESAEVFRQQNRPELADAEEAEQAVIENYLPRQLSDHELRTRLEAIADQLQAGGPADLGRVMGVASRELAGQAEGKAIAATARQVLASR